MEVHFDQIASESKVAYTFTNFYMHEFTEKHKSKVAEGNCLILQWHKQDVVDSFDYLKMNNFDFCKRINDSIFIKVRYPKSTSFLFFHEYNNNVVLAVSVTNQSSDLVRFEEVLKKKGIVIDYQSPNLKYEIKVRVDYNIDNVLENQIIITYNAVTKIGKVFGGFFGKINQKVIKQSTQAEDKFQQKVDRFSRESLSQSTRSTWDRIKQKASKANDSITTLIKPINESISTVVTNVETKFNNSQNRYVKAVREFTKQTQNSINEGYKTDPQPSGKVIPPVPPNSDIRQPMMGQQLVINEEHTASGYPEL